ncbi:hypothetical protein FSP39_011643 [Pinctada imbricata]|uniref:FAM86 N-terminal domain-containing protein n=1 Tax=Pinctada imbricata TaxID=66713 RepID=A0AA88XRM9_PINIB|nr:hypothetical protein FSP39_011643 [Pinctada imbricata]
MYEAYTDLLQQGETDDEDMLCHKTYFLPNGDNVSLQESINIISQGTTGLSTWQAALNLAEWAIEKCRLFDNRKVLELGSGLGMTGLSICKQCNVKSFTFSDCHYQVLYLLMRNIEINLSQRETNSEDTDLTLEPENSSKEKKMMKSICRQLSVNSEITNESSSDIMEISYNSMVSSTGGIQKDYSYSDCDNFEPNSIYWSTTDNENIYELRSDDRVRLAKLDWESSNKQFIESLDPDIILAADVVYDKTIIPALVFVLHILLSKTTECGEKPVAYVASTIRNEDTRDHFLISLGAEGLSYTITEPPKEKVFFYDDVIPVEILKIYKA